MQDYRNNLKRILNNTGGDDRSLQNSRSLILALLGSGNSSTTGSNNASDLAPLLHALAAVITKPSSETAKRAQAKLGDLKNDPNAAALLPALNEVSAALRKVPSSERAVNQALFEQALKPKQTKKRDCRKGKRYTVIRQLTGCDLINRENQIVFHCSEHQIHDFNLDSGDIVEALPLGESLHGEAEILRKVGHSDLPSSQYDKIAVFKYAVVQGKPGQLGVSRDIHGKKLRINHKPVLVPVDASLYDGNLGDGSIVDLAWYEGDVRLKSNPASAVAIRWIYELEQPKKKKQKSSKSHKAQASLLPKLDLDLHYQRVGVAIGDNQSEAVFDGIISRYHGISVPVDAFQGRKRVIERQLQSLDIVILVTAFAAHDSTWNIQEAASKYGVKFAVSSNKGYRSFERALYRAANGMPAYEGNQQLSYKMAKD